jgi:ABC-type multidrug transport system fused ATPase/permease subunit
VIGLLRTYLRPYAARLVVVLLLLLVGAIGNLYLPDLNADIIDQGVVRGDTDFILRTGAFMLGVTAVLGVASVLDPVVDETSDWTLNVLGTIAGLMALVTTASAGADPSAPPLARLGSDVLRLVASWQAEPGRAE